MLEHHEVHAPYPGLRCFERHEAEIFFGREAHISRLLDILLRERFLAVIGPSGSGKSSLIRAGMLPALATGWLGTGSDWRIVIMRPGDRPVRRLASALLELGALGVELSGAGVEETRVSESLGLVEAELRRGPLGLVDLVADTRRVATGAQPFNILVLVDQFEEIFRYPEGGTAQADEADIFVNILLRSRHEQVSRIHVALAMRSDFLGNCVQFLELPEAINHAQYLTPRLSREQLTAAITRPAAVFGGTIEPGLVNELINAVAHDPDQLPILQHALSRMWSSASKRSPGSPGITREDLDATGGVTGALSRHAESVLAELWPEQQALAEVIFRSITERGTIESGGRDIRRPQRLASIARACDLQPERLRDLVPPIEAFAREGVNFITHALPLDADARIDISHESLIRQWDRLRSWVSDEAERARHYRRWRDRAAEWRQGGELLTGADLAAAVEWRDGRATKSYQAETPGTTSSATPQWKPTAQWAARYAQGDPQSAQAEFDEVLDFIRKSQTAELEEAEIREEVEFRRLEMEQGRLVSERKRLQAEERYLKTLAESERTKAEAAAREQALAEMHARKSRRLATLSVAVAVVAVLAALAAGYFALKGYGTAARHAAFIPHGEPLVTASEAGLRPRQGMGGCGAPHLASICGFYPAFASFSERVREEPDERTLKRP